MDVFWRQTSVFFMLHMFMFELLLLKDYVKEKGQGNKDNFCVWFTKISEC